MTESSQLIHELVSHCDVDAALAAAACNIICAAPEDEQPDLFIQFILEARYTPTDSSWTLPAIRLDTEMGDEPGRLRTALDAEDLTDQEYHRRLWQEIRRHSPQQQYTLIFFCIMDRKHIPRISLKDTLTLSNEEYEKAAGELNLLTVNFLRCIHDRPMQYTQQASLFLKILEAEPDPQKRTLLLATLMMRIL